MTMLNYISQGGRLVWIGDAGVEAIQIEEICYMSALKMIETMDG